jgi:diguanylate cyclase (GGDEF)-like protein
MPSSASRSALNPKRPRRVRTPLGNLLGTRLRPALWRSRGVSPQTQVQVLEQALTVSRRQRQALGTELAQARAESARLRAELAGTQAGERTARHQAMHDQLTGLPNSRMFMEQLQKALRLHTQDHSRLTVMYLDIDGFKHFNDEHGHKVGDGVLKTVGARLAKSVRAGDLVARLGGDEFVCLLEANLTQPQLLALAQKLCRSIAAPMQLDSLTLLTHASIGLSCYPDDGETAETLLDRADAAMYQAKQQRTEVMFASDKAADAAATGQGKAHVARSARHLYGQN